MKTILILLFTVPVLIVGQTKSKISKEQEKKIYHKAIHEYLEATYGKEKNYPDTLFMGPAEEHDLNSLPAKVDSIPVMLIKQEALKKKLNYRPSLPFVNIVNFGLGAETIDFIFISFMVEKNETKDNFWPLHNYNLQLKRNPKTGELKVGKSMFEYNYSNKYTGSKK